MCACVHVCVHVCMCVHVCVFIRMCVFQPIRFLLELSRIAQFEERVHCFLFWSVFSEKLSAIEHHLGVVGRACQVRKEGHGRGKVIRRRGHKGITYGY